MKTITLEKDPQGGYLVTQGNLDSGCLAPDEALGVVAHALYGDGSPHRFLKPQAIPPPKLLPCPHCGKTQFLMVDKSDCGYCAVLCNASGIGNFDNRGCGARSGFMPTEKEAIELWNKRSTGAVKIVNVVDAEAITKFIASAAGKNAVFGVIGAGRRLYEKPCPVNFSEVENFGQEPQHEGTENEGSDHD